MMKVGLMKKRTDNPRVAAPPIPPPPASAADEFEAPAVLRCRVCDTPGANKRHDMLCWVCRRLKISAWKDVEKMALPE